VLFKCVIIIARFDLVSKSTINGSDTCDYMQKTPFLKSVHQRGKKKSVGGRTGRGSGGLPRGRRTRGSGRGGPSKKNEEGHTQIEKSITVIRYHVVFYLVQEAN
jgi:hypothetical protein